jgi:hypothetical protein
MKRRQGSTAALYTQAEIAYLLVFVFAGSLSLLFLQYRAAREEVAFLLELIEKMEYKKNAAYPCWIRPDGVIPEVAGTLIIHSPEYTEVSRTNGGSGKIDTSIDTGGQAARRDALFTNVRRLFQEDNQFASRNRCYIRVKVENRTNDYALFLETAQVLKSMGMVVVNE